MKLFSIVVLLALVAAVLVPQSPLYYKSLMGNEGAVVTKTKDVDVVQNTDTLESDEEMIAEQSISGIQEDNVSVSSSSDSSFEERFLGDADAPITILEFSSLSCGHCGSFHKDVYPELKKNYIDTGKAKLVMIDFPLNLPALQGSMLAHCMVGDRYFDFLQLLFTSQQAWLSGDHLAKLKQNAQLAGLSSEEIDTCLDNKAMEDEILARMEDAQAKWQISSTPSFIINDGAEKIIGNKPYLEFAATLETLLLEDAATQE